MSYILDALRKSERDRQLGKAPPLPLLLADPPRQHRRWWPLLLLALLLSVNGAAWVYFGFGGGSANPSAPPAVSMGASHNKTEGHVNSTENVPDVNSSAMLTKTSGRTAEDPKATAALTDSLSSATNGEVPPQKASDTHNIAAVAEKSAVTAPSSHAKKSQSPALQKTAEGEKSAKNAKAESGIPSFNKLEVKQIKESLAVAPDLARSQDNIAATGANRETIPPLSAMPDDIRLRMPPLTVNVLAYSSAPKERFAVINMTKYVHGDVIQGGAVLLEIRPDELVLELDGAKFRIPQR